MWRTPPYPLYDPFFRAPPDVLDTIMRAMCGELEGETRRPDEHDHGPMLFTTEDRTTMTHVTEVKRTDIGRYIRGANDQPFKIVEVFDSGMVLAIATDEHGKPLGGRGATRIRADNCHFVVFDLQHFVQTGEMVLLP